jgi:phosphoserine aminotransferase
MSELDPIVLPSNLVPSDGRFGSGPALVRNEAVERLAAVADHYLGTSHRRQGVRTVVEAIRRGLASLFALPDGYEVVLGVGGATMFWEVAAHSLIAAKSQHVSIGEFSSKFAAVVDAMGHLEKPSIIQAAHGSAAMPVREEGVDAYALIHNETSTGVMAPLVRPGDTAALVLVDATSAAGAVTLDPLVFDAYYFSPQKAFGSEGGLWIALCSPNALERVEALATERVISPMTSLQIAVENARLNQTYNTPALATLFLLADQVAWLEAQGGLAWAEQRARASSAVVYDWAATSEYATPFVADASLRSPTVVTVELDPSVSAEDIATHLQANGIVDVLGYRKIAQNQLRIATFPNIDPDDVERLVGAIDFIVEQS